MGELFSIASTIFRIVSRVEIFLSVVAVVAVCAAVITRRALRKRE